MSTDRDTASVPAELAAFVYHEAMLLDTQRYDEWLTLYAESGLYWMPLSQDQAPGDEAPSLLHEDLLLLRLRIQRYRNPRAHSLHPAVRGLRILQAPQVLTSDASAELHRMRTPFLYMETQGDTQKMLAATAYHTIEGRPGAFRIRMKKVELLNADACLPAIQLLL
ncbi:aromatic-ring-hydroxylating dioxygenase subunit beta [Achromobacter agilis]|uniref:aromatic-ring-hydroxylating dioxygenase subunit beta n=1 Tax=Achromobacter agilis TaxID=1353888 RepID=UPI0013EC3480|nr:aromatic-ring-hydroxylating dioxygenase subunit beta [Achromobacter agilis]